YAPERSVVVAAQIFVPQNQNLPARDDLEQPVKLSRVETAIDVGVNAFLKGDGSATRGLGGKGLFEAECLVARLAERVPVRGGPVGRVAQEDEPLQGGVVGRGPLCRRPPAEVDGGGVPQNSGGGAGGEFGVVYRQVGPAARWEVLVSVEEVG